MLKVQDIIKTFEKFEPIPYRCVGGHKTIGYGHRIWPHETLKGPLSEEESTVLLEEDLWRFSVILHRDVKQQLLIHEHAALLSFVFNVGPAAFYRSSLRQKMNRGDFMGAANEFPKWTWCKGRKLKGLLKRRLFEQQVFQGKITIQNDFWC